jgi:hypothetical protein
MVTGTMTIKTSKQPKQFVQTFFLAPQHQESGEQRFSNRAYDGAGALIRAAGSGVSS